MSAKAWRGRRQHERRARSALRFVWRHHESIRRLYPVKADWLNLEKGS